MEDSRVAKCLAAKRESKSVEFKEQFNPADTKQALEVLKDLVAIANSGGGALVIGIYNNGNASGFDVKPVIDYDHAKYCDLIRKYTGQHYADFEVLQAERDRHQIAVFIISAPDVPLVFEKPGTYAVENNKQQTAFSQGTVYFRHGAKSEPCTSDDLRKFIEQRNRELQDQLVKGLRKVAVAPRGSHLEVIPAKGTISGATSSGGQPVPVRITSDPHAQNAVLVDKSEMFPHRQKDAIAKIKAGLPGGPTLNQFDFRAVVQVHHVADDDRFSWKPQFSARQYSEAFVEWVIEKVSADPMFFQKARQNFSNAV